MFGCSTLGGNKSIRSAQLACPGVDKAPFLLSQIQLVHQFLYILLSGQDQLKSFPGRITPLKGVANAVQQYIVALVSSVRFITVKQSRPLELTHGSTAAVGQVI